MCLYSANHVVRVQQDKEFISLPSRRLRRCGVDDASAPKMRTVFRPSQSRGWSVVADPHLHRALGRSPAWPRQAPPSHMPACRLPPPQLKAQSVGQPGKRCMLGAGVAALRGWTCLHLHL